MLDLAIRHDRKEYMDQPLNDERLVRETYRQLRRINVLTLGYWPSLDAVKYFVSRTSCPQTLSILDIGCGDGETLRRIECFGRRHGYKFQLTGFDLNPSVIKTAARVPASAAKFAVVDVLTDAHETTYDVIISSLMMHHLSDDQCVDLMRWMSAHARRGWFISDLHRHFVSYYFIKYFSSLAGFSPMICHDAPLSVARSFRRCEWEALLRQTGLERGRADILWYPNFRYGVRYEQ